MSLEPSIATNARDLREPVRTPEWWVIIPNALTVSRLAFAGALILLLSIWRYPKPDEGFTPPTRVMLTAALLFALGALTDLLDGILARRWGVISRFGRIMDPFADKLLVVGTFLMLAGPAFDVQLSTGKPFQVSGVSMWMALVVLSRELLVTIIRAVLEARGIDFSASFSGKLKMGVQCVCVLGMFMVLAFERVTPDSPWRRLIDAAVWTTVIVTALSIAPYAVRAARAGRQA